MKYKDYTIEPETDLWALSFGSKVKIFIDGERVVSASSIEEAKEFVDDQIEKRFTDEFGCIDHSALNIAERYWKNEQL